MIFFKNPLGTFLSPIHVLFNCQISKKVMNGFDQPTSPRYRWFVEKHNVDIDFNMKSVQNLISRYG